MTRAILAARLAAPPPVNTVAPTTTGTVTLDADLGGGDGTWTGATGFLYRWKRDGVAIPGATAAAYRPEAADLAIPGSESFPVITREVAGVGPGGTSAYVAPSNSVSFDPVARIESLGAGTLATWVRGNGMVFSGALCTDYNDAGPNNHDFTQGTSGLRPAEGTSGALKFADYDGVDNQQVGGATSLYAQATEFHRLHVARCKTTPTSTGAVALFYLNAGICMDRQSGHTGDAFSTRSGTTYFQAGGYEAGGAGTGAAEVPVPSPTVKHLFDSSLDTSNVLRAQVDAGTIGTRTRSGTLVVTGNPFIFGANYLGSAHLDFEHHESFLCRKKLSAAVLADIRAYLGTKHSVTFEQEVAPSLAQVWGNGWDSISGGNRFWSALSMMVFDTDSPWVDVEYYTNSTGVDPRYGALVVAKSSTGSVKPTTQLGVIEPVAVVGRHRSGRIATGLTIGGGTSRIYVINGALSGFIGAQAQRAWIADGAALTIQSEGASAATIGVEGWGSAKLGGAAGALGEGFGYKSTAGVLEGSPWSTRRSEFLARLTQMAPGAAGAFIVLTVHTNDATSGTGSTDAGVQADALLDDLQATFPTTPILWITLFLRHSETGTTAAIRTAEETACIAHGVDYVSGFDLGSEALTTADLCVTPDLHPNEFGHQKIANVGLDWLTAEAITGRVVAITNSFQGSGTWSTGPDAGETLYAAVDGCVALIRKDR